jgi:hypothetical protein
MIRKAVKPQYASLPAEDLEAVLAESGIDAAAMEGFFDDVSRFVQHAAPVVAQVATRALPGVISGATTGAALGPWGALGGALLGGVTSAVSGGQTRPGTTSGGAGAAGGISGALPALAGLAGSGGNPAGVLLGVLQRPETQQALMSLALGSAGRSTVQAGSSRTPVPASAFANLLSTLASRVFNQAEASAEPTEGYPTYLHKSGVLAVDPALPEARAGRLLEMLAEVSYVPRSTRQTTQRRQMYTEADEYYDEIDGAELAAINLEGSDYELDE